MISMPQPAAVLRLALAACLACTVPALAQQADTTAAERLAATQNSKAQLERRLASVATLLDNSSGARQIEASADARAAQKRAEAKKVYEEAQSAFKAEDYARTSRLLSQATGLMFDAVRLAAPEKVVAEKQRDDFAARLESVKALLEAQKRISAEKGDGKAAADTTREIERLVRESEQLAGAGKHETAQSTLTRAYLIAKAAIGSMRGGDTLVRSLNFASKQEEYHYELDRNDTHRMLIQVLVDEKRSTDGMIKNFVTRAAQLRGEAEAAARGGDHEKGVKLLEDSTSELVKAIRNAGVFIPG